MVGVVTVTHAFVSQLEDSPDAAAIGELVPSNWNDDHVVAGAAPIDSPAFVNTPTAPTPPFGDTSTRIATMAAIAQAIGSVPQQTISRAGNVTIANGIALVIARNTTPAAFTITLPLSTELVPEEITIKDRMLTSGGTGGAGTFNISIATQGTETIDGMAGTALDVDNQSLTFRKIRNDAGEVTGEGYYQV